MKLKSGYTLIELLVVVLVFSILAVVIVQSLALSLRSSRKSENLGEVKENVDLAMNVIERSLRNAKSVSCTPTNITYQDEYGTSPSPQFNCSGGVNGFIASGSGSVRLTSTDIFIDCSTGTVFSCPVPVAGVPPMVIINLTGRDAQTTGAEGATVTSTTRILLRTY